jgi:hypothetical protein
MAAENQPMKHVTLKLTLAQAKSLMISAHNGADWIRGDRARAKAYLGGPRGIAAYDRAASTLAEALAAADPHGMAMHLLRELVPDEGEMSRR